MPRTFFAREVREDALFKPSYPGFESYELWFEKNSIRIKFGYLTYSFDKYWFIEIYEDYNKIQKRLNLYFYQTKLQPRDAALAAIRTSFFADYGP